mmetsp:Transcript_126277/g.357118  ORF Transcript_126277/g.357118 Transcript_126277/m.357118 type:complete len:283 (+) Transcript_126277:1069-1917(+)
MRSSEVMADACEYSAGTSSSFGRAARCCAASFWMNFSTQPFNCFKDNSSSSRRRVLRTSARAFSISSILSTTWDVPVCCDPFAGSLGSSSQPDMARRHAAGLPVFRVPTFTMASLSLFRDQASSIAASFPSARSRNRPEADALSSVRCCTESESSLSLCLVSCFRCWCSFQRRSRSLRCSSQARSICASIRWAKSFAWCIRSCCSALLCDRSACSVSCFTLASRSAVSFRRCSSHFRVSAFSDSWNSASAPRISSSCCVHSLPASCVCETNSTFTPSGKFAR